MGLLPAYWPPISISTCHCRPALLVRAARHYESAEQILIRQAVMSSCQFVSAGQAELLPIGHWVLVECPARIDLSGEQLCAQQLQEAFYSPGFKGVFFLSLALGVTLVSSPYPAWVGHKPSFLQGTI